MSTPVHITVHLSPDRDLTGEDVADVLRELDGVRSAEVVPAGDLVIVAHGLEEMNKRAAEGYRVVAGWSYGAGAIALMERS